MKFFFFYLAFTKLSFFFYWQSTMYIQLEIWCICCVILSTITVLYFCQYWVNVSLSIQFQFTFTHFTIYSFVCKFSNIHSHTLCVPKTNTLILQYFMTFGKTFLKRDLTIEASNTWQSCSSSNVLLIRGQIKSFIVTTGGRIDSWDNLLVPLPPFGWDLT